MATQSNTIDYYFSVFSPWAYMGDARLKGLAKAHDKVVRYHPLLTPLLFPATGGIALKDRAQPRKDYRMAELKRWRDLLGVELNLEPKHFPVPEAAASQLILATQDAGEDPGTLVHAIFRAVWVEERDINDPATLTEIANAVGLDGQELSIKSQSSEFEQACQDETQAAIKAGVFGYPTYVYGDELLWGQDRLDFLERALNAG